MIVKKEDLLRIRQIAAEHGAEFTPLQLIELLKKIRTDLKIEDGPGLVTWLKHNGNNSPS